MTYKAISYTVGELADRGMVDLPDQLQSHTHLIYSSPAALAFNSPGAEGFGVKRAALAIPGSVMLLVAPGCCGRNTSLISNLPGYDERFFYINMDETDIVTGRHLKKIPQAVEDLCNSLARKPEVVMICITCVDALLGTDMERVCRKAQERVGIPVRPSYMYALTREGRKPPMVHVRQSLYSLLEPAQKMDTAINILGFFAPLQEDCELYELLHSIGLTDIREISRCGSLSEYEKMAEARFNLILNPEARLCAGDMEKRLGIPPIEMRRVYQIDKIRSQYKALSQILGSRMKDDAICQETIRVIQSFKSRHARLRICVGECLNADPFELSLALVRYGMDVREIYGTVTAENFIYVKHLAQLSPETRVYSNLEPTMIYYDPSSSEAELTIGKDAGYYHPGVPNLAWNSDIQPFGYAGLKKLILSMEEALLGEDREANRNRLKNERLAADEQASEIFDSHACRSNAPIIDLEAYRKGFRRFLTPFAPDQSGAVSVLFELGGIQVVCDAGGCVGNICGFDEPRWFRMRSAIFSAGLRDMDAILGRDEKLVEKLADAIGKIDMEFAAIIGTPVPSVIGTDYHALKRMTERKVKIPVMAIDTNGMQLYDVGAQKAYLELFRTFAEDVCESIPEEGILGVLGVNPMDHSDVDAGTHMREILQKEGWTSVYTYGMNSGLDTVRRAGLVQKNLVTAPSGWKAARYLKERFGTEYEVRDPLAGRYVPEDLKPVDGEKCKVLILAQQVTANTIRQILRDRGIADVNVATWFMRIPELSEEGDVSLKEEKQMASLAMKGDYDVIFADPDLWKLIPGYVGRRVDLPHFAVSGRLV